MTKQDSPSHEIGAPVGPDPQKDPVAPPATQKKEDDREYDHRGVLMPRRTRIGGIIMPQ